MRVLPGAAGWAKVVQGWAETTRKVHAMIKRTSHTQDSGWSWN